IAHYLHLGPSLSLTNNVIPDDLKESKDDSQQSFLLLQQRRLADKLKERLGYLGVYYKRNPSHFYRNLSPQEKRKLLALLSAEYRDIVLAYFNQDINVNDLLDQFVNHAFFADLAISQILEIHMELMDEFAQHLKLEGRSEEVLLDYRLTLIDILAHLGEMYRRSIPREDFPFDVYYQTD
ncbi:MAG: circadian clock protein KaiA, partial [Cyanobacteriota bacterium]